MKTWIVVLSAAFIAIAAFVFFRIEATAKPLTPEEIRIVAALRASIWGCNVETVWSSEAEWLHTRAATQQKTDGSLLQKIDKLQAEFEETAKRDDCSQILGNFSDYVTWVQPS